MVAFGVPVFFLLVITLSLRSTVIRESFHRSISDIFVLLLPDPAMAALRKLWDMWSRTGSLFPAVDKRRLQHELDTHKLFLLTSFQREAASGNREKAEELEKLAEETPFEEQQQQVQELVHSQLRNMGSTLDSILLEAPIVKPTPAPIKRRISGLSFAFGVQPEPMVPSCTDVVKTRPLNRAQVAAAFEEQLGFTLHISPSGIVHEEAGLGLYIKGRAEAGTVVSLYPGVIYSPSHYRYIPGYPKVDVNNAYLISRFDGLVVDGKPWGKGDDKREWWDGSEGCNESFLTKETLDSNVSMKAQHTARDQINVQPQKRPLSFWQFVGGGKAVKGPLEGAELERRNPLAFGHFANHPPKGIQPNVMICSYTLSISGQESMRPYIPNVVFGNDEELDMQRHGPLWVNEGRKERPDDEDERNLSTVENLHLPKNESSAVRTLVLVATREVQDEELLLNYRLSSYVHQPSWYHPVNVEEEKRRWD